MSIYTQGSEGELNPVLYHGGRMGYSTPRSQRSNDHDPQQWKRYRQGLETDRRVLSGIQNERDIGRTIFVANDSCLVNAD